MLRRRCFALVLYVMPLVGQQPMAGPEHKKLAALAGTWDAVAEWGAPGGKPVQTKGVSERHLRPGGLWLVDDLSVAAPGGNKHDVLGVLGFDPSKGKYVQSWADSVFPMLVVMEGGFDKEGKVLTMTGIGPGWDGSPAKLRLVTTWRDADTELFEVFMPGPDGKEMAAIKTTYTRRAAKQADAPAKK